VPDLRQMRYFVAVAETLNFRQAAENLHLAQPALSAAIRQLETELGVQLLERTTRSVRLTPTGEVFLERARKTLAVAEEAFAVGRDAVAGIAGQVRVGASPIARNDLVIPLQNTWAAARPGIAVHVTEAATGPLQVAVGAGELDLAIVWCPLHEPGLRYERLRDWPVMAHVATDHPLAGQGKVTLERLAEETILVGSGEASRGYTEAVVGLFASEGLHPRTLADPYPDLGMLAAIEGQAVVVGSPIHTARSREDLALLELSPERSFPFELVWRDREPAPTLTALLDIARQTRDSEGWVKD
jgi:DNA-binding transcriptional LysR family regulator